MILEQLKQFDNNYSYGNQKISLLPDVKKYIRLIEKNRVNNNQIIFLLSHNPHKFITIFFASILTNSSIFLLNPNWKKTELEQVYQLVKPNFVFTDTENYQYTDKYIHSPKGIMIPTGGTSGKIKFAIHTWATLRASAMGFCQFWGEKKINSLCCLPLYHVSGLMQIIRAFVTGAKLDIYEYSSLKKEIPLHNYQNFFISLVPTQLKFFLDTNSMWLKQFKIVLVGGSHTNQELQNLCKSQEINLALTYGMTETASGVTILKPEDFFNHKIGSGEVLPHAQISIDNRQENFGKIIVKSSSLFKGYYPQYQDYSYFETDDLGYFDGENYLHIIGRNSRKIVSGGENIYPVEIENLIMKMELVKDVVILGKNDSYWGQIVCAIYVNITDTNKHNLVEQIKTKLRSHLSHYKIPKIWLKVDQIPRNAQGKINYGELEKMVNHNPN